MIVAIHQPNFLPRLKVLQKLAAADLWIVLDDVQFASRDYQHRAMLCPIGNMDRPYWCTIPVTRGNGRATIIRELQVAKARISESAGRSIAHAFRNRVLGEAVSGIMSEVEYSPTPISDIGVRTTQLLLARAGQDCPTVLASELRSSDLKGAKTQGILELCQAVGASVYLADSGSLNYLDTSVLVDAGMSVRWQMWNPPRMDLDTNLLRNGSALNVLARDEECYVENLSKIELRKSMGGSVQ